MGHPLRNFDSHQTWFLTARCFQARFLMTPHSTVVREVTGGVLARAAQKYGVQLYAYAFLSNHFHLVVRAQGQSIADFMQYLLGNLSKKLAPLCRQPWWGRFWERRYSASPVLDDAALEDRVRYVLAHGVKEGLVAKTSEWEGLHCAAQFQDEEARLFPWYDWTLRWGARRADSAEVPGRYAETYAQPETLHLTPLPHWAGLPPEQRQALARQLVLDVEASHAGRSVLGMEAVKKEDMGPQRQRKRSPMPWCHVSTTDGHRQHRDNYRQFLQAFNEASHAWRRGHLTVEFPSGCFRPGLRYPTSAQGRCGAG